MDNVRFVDFAHYCETCVYREVREIDEPCSECLSVPAQEGTDKPVNWAKG